MNHTQCWVLAPAPAKNSCGAFIFNPNSSEVEARDLKDKVILGITRNTQESVSKTKTISKARQELDKAFLVYSKGSSGKWEEMVSDFTLTSYPSC